MDIIKSFKQAASLGSYLLVCVGITALLAACKAAPPVVAPPQPVTVQLSADADVNPDVAGRPSPLVARVYQLRQDSIFMNADFFALYDHDKETLAADLVSREELVFKPGESRTLELKFDPQVRLLAVLAGYRDLRNAQWRALYVLPQPSGKNKKAPTVMLQITFARASVTISPQH